MRLLVRVCKNGEADGESVPREGWKEWKRDESGKKTFGRKKLRERFFFVFHLRCERESGSSLCFGWQKNASRNTITLLPFSLVSKKITSATEKKKGGKGKSERPLFFSSLFSSRFQSGLVFLYPRSSRLRPKPNSENMIFVIFRPSSFFN